MEQLEMLWNYQQADSAADRLEKEIKRSPTRQKLIKYRDSLLEQQTAFKRVDGEVAAMGDRLDVLKDAVALTEDQLKNLIAKIESSEDSLEQVTAYISEVKRLQGNLTAYEQETRRIRKDAADRERIQHEIKVRYAKYKAEFDKLKQAYDIEYKDKSAQLDEMRKAAEEKTAGISKEMLDRYRAIKLHSVPPLARLNGSQCGGCNMSLPSAVTRAIKAGELIECETCGRLLLPGV
ncbi:MAG: hypothetical protein IKI84_04065 [Clostridia bacterium]|nr:hypothetical protein [Clostridia bacterium]